ncbi:hypothetical protein HMPREF9418_1297 [Neisseria macacae ATCC 33926]|uniref:Uncharacterized protein n=1 Tax=Neisseria macacae ATCC 33926 TaxID=997348 RepID=A0AA36XKL7_9NEIS|nr:hypothetical protein HMPREF9418_1297 [Neisseria macacae ATCC 33926]
MRRCYQSRKNTPTRKVKGRLKPFSDDLLHAYIPTSPRICGQ